MPVCNSGISIIQMLSSPSLIAEVKANIQPLPPFGVDLNSGRRRRAITILSYTEELDCQNITEAISIIFLFLT
jgi:hypothetical protein